MSTKPDKDLFKAHLSYWKNKLSLGHQFIEVAYDYAGVGAECSMNHESLIATISIGEVDEVWTEAILARHEMLELLLEPIRNITWKDVNEDRFYRAGHEVIHRLENILPIPSDEDIGYIRNKKEIKCHSKKGHPKK